MPEPARIPYVSRGGLKLRHALDTFAIDVKGLVCADLGCSTGGFTDCLLQAGAAKVHAVDTASDRPKPSSIANVSARSSTRAVSSETSRIAASRWSASMIMPCCRLLRTRSLLATVTHCPPIRPWV